MNVVNDLCPLLHEYPTCPGALPCACQSCVLFLGAILKVNSTAGAAHGAGQVPYNRGSRDQAAQGAIRPRSTARNFTVIGPMRDEPAQSKLCARREGSVASRV